MELINYLSTDTWTVDISLKNVDFFKNKSSFFFISSFFVISCSLAIFSSFLFFLKKLINSAGIYASVETSLWTTRPVFQKIRCALRFMRLAKRRSSSYQDACGRLVIHRDYLGARSFWILSEPVLYCIDWLILSSRRQLTIYVFPKCSFCYNEV